MPAPRALFAALAAFLAAPTLAQTIPAAPENGGPRHWEVTGVSTALNLRAEPSLAGEVVARLAPGAILSNLGCTGEGGRVWCDVQPFTGGPRGYAAADYLSPAVSPTGAVATGPDDSALRAGQGAFDATGTVPCAVAEGQPMGQCAFGVARAGGGDATVIVTKPDGRTRAIFVTRGIPLGTDSSQADPASFDFRATKEADLHFIRIGPERYEIPDAVIFGG